MLKSMNISFTVNEAYVKYLTVAMRSILDNAEDGEEFRFYVINSGIGEDSKRKLESLKSIRDFYIEYISLSAGDIPPIPGKFQRPCQSGNEFSSADFLAQAGIGQDIVSGL